MLNQMNNQSSFQSMLTIGMVILIIIIATSLSVGGQVYWWQKSIAEKEKREYERQVSLLQQEIAFLREDLGKQLLKQSGNIKEQVPATDLIYKNSLAGLEEQVITALKNREMTSLASLVHPEKGVRFSPFAYIDTGSDLVFSPEKIRNFFADSKKYTWGYRDSNGLPLRLTSKDYFEKFVYDCDYAATDVIGYNKTVGRSITASNIFEVYPHSIIVEYGKEKSGLPEKEEDWRSLRLVFEKKGDQWYLVGIVHDQWKL